MAPPIPGILQLSNELLRDVLDHIEADPEKLVSLDRRAYLSQESFRPPPLPSRDQAQDIGSFRLTCKRLSELGAIHQFARVTTRFSRKGFKRLENIANQPHLAKHVRKFSYMVPYFYVEGRERVHDIMQSFSQSLGSLDVRNFDRKVREQKELVNSGEDARVLHEAISAFTSLQHVQILRVQDYEDSVLIGYLRQHQELANLVELKWAPACSHSTKTLGAALLASHSPCSRFSSPMLSPQSAEVLAAHTPKTFDSLAHRLTSLELHFDDGIDLDRKMMGLSGLFRTVFTAAENMQAIHIGFPSHRPLSLRLEDLFHNIKWDRLAAFGIQAWKLDAEEIIAFVRRHRERLRGLRLRDVLLKDESMWKDVLAYLRDEAPRLDWVSLRRIGYARHFDEQWAAAGVEVPDDPPGGESESEDDLNEEGTRESDRDSIDHGNSENHIFGDSDSDADSALHSDDDEERGPQTDGMDFPPLSPGTPSSAPWCQCNSEDYGLGGLETLNDDGVFVSNHQRKIWEKWVVRRCIFDHRKHSHPHQSHPMDQSQAPSPSEFASSPAQARPFLSPRSAGRSQTSGAQFASEEEDDEEESSEAFSEFSASE